MSAHDHLSSQQLRMFIPAGELRGYNLNPHDVDAERVAAHEQWANDPGEDSAPTLSHNDIWEIKAEEADERGLWHDIQNEGVKRPISIYHGPISAFGDRSTVNDTSKPTIANGGHRVAAASETDADQLVPVKHYDTKHHSFIRAVQGGNPEQHFLGPLPRSY